MQKAITNYELRITNLKSKIVNLKSQILLLLTVYCSLFTVFYGCASAKNNELPRALTDAADFNQKGVDEVAAGNYERALVEFQRALNLNMGMDNQKGMAVNFINIGRLRLLMDNFDDAKTMFDSAIRIGAGLNDQFILSEGYASLGRYYYLAGNDKDAVDVLEKAVSIDRKEGHRTVSSRLNALGIVYKEGGRIEEAEKAYNNALKAGKAYEMYADVADSFRGLGDIVAKRGDYKKAMELYENALLSDKKAGSAAGISAGLFKLGVLSIENNGDSKTALGFFLRAYAVDSSRGDIKRTLKDLNKIIEIYEEIGDKRSVETYLLKKEMLLKKEIPPEKGMAGEK